MKIRTGFVSNSSSSSFVVIGTKPSGVNSSLLTGELAERVWKTAKKHNWMSRDAEWNGTDPLYVTQLLSDAGTWYEPFEHLPLVAYGDGSHSGCPHAFPPQDFNKYHVEHETFSKPYEADEDGNCDGCDSVFLKKCDVDPPDELRERVENFTLA